VWLFKGPLRLEAYNDLREQIAALEKQKRLLEGDQAVYRALSKDVSALLEGMKKVLLLNAGRGKGFPADVRETVFRNLDIAGSAGGLLVCPTHSLEPEVPWENVEAYVLACRDYSRS